MFFIKIQRQRRWHRGARHQGPCLHLGLQAGQRRAQLVGRIGHKAALPLCLRVHQGKQAIERVHQRAHLGGRCGFVNRAQIAGGAALHGIRQVHQRLEGPAHRPVNGQPRRRHQHQVGQQHPHQQLLRPLLARIRPIGQRHHQLAGARAPALHRHPVGDAAILHAVKLRRLRGGHAAMHPAFSQQQPARSVTHAVRRIARVLAQEIFYRRGQQQQGRFAVEEGRGQHGIGQGRQQAQQAQIVPPCGFVRRAVVEPDADRGQRHQGQHQQHQQAVAQIGGHRAKSGPLHGGARVYCACNSSR